jgi:ssDNA-binding Zn-finger/Zn-ribbon topoisomerase 1
MMKKLKEIKNVNAICPYCNKESKFVILVNCFFENIKASVSICPNCGEILGIKEIETNKFEKIKELKS